MFCQWIPNLVVRGEWLLQSSKPRLAMVFACVPFLCYLFSAIFKLRQAMDVRRKKTTDLVFDVLFFLREVVFFVLSSVFCIGTLLSVIIKKICIDTASNVLTHQGPSRCPAQHSHVGATPWPAMTRWSLQLRSRRQAAQHLPRPWSIRSVDAVKYSRTNWSWS